MKIIRIRKKNGAVYDYGFYNELYINNSGIEFFDSINKDGYFLSWHDILDVKIIENYVPEEAREAIESYRQTLQTIGNIISTAIRDNNNKE